MKEFVQHSKRLNIKNGKLQKEISEVSKLNCSKRFSRSSSNLFSSTPRKQSKRINETEPTWILQSKDPWKFG